MQTACKCNSTSAQQATLHRCVYRYSRGLRQAYLPKSHSQQFSLLIRKPIRPIGAGSWQCFHAAFCTQYFVICFWRKAVGCSLSCIAQVQNIHHFKISNYFWYILASLGKAFKAHGMKHSKRWPFQRSQDSMEQRCFQFAFNLKGLRVSLCCYFLLLTASGEQWTWIWKSRKISLGSGHQGSMANKSFCKQLWVIF